MENSRNTKIVATLGPASSDVEILTELFKAGVNVFRLNFSHGSHADHAERVKTIRRLEMHLGRPAAILADLQGPKIRVGEMASDVELVNEQSFRLDMDPDIGDAERACLPHGEVFQALSKGADLLIDDGRIRLRVEEATTSSVACKVVTGGVLKSRKGVNLPDALLPIAAMTEKDRVDLEFALAQGVDWVALSFVQRPEDVAEVKKIVAGRAGVMAKIEKPAAMKQIDEILEISDGIMVARGDLGVELPAENIPGLQKRLIRRARNLGKPVVVATQMLESMVALPVPTRAEVSDVATAIYDGADAVMLSAETASGDFPLEAVNIMHKVALEVEGDSLYHDRLDADHMDPEATAADAITSAARQVAETVGAKAIVTYTTSGSTALRASRERPLTPLVVLTPRLETARRLAVSWGLHNYVTPDASSFTSMVQGAINSVRDGGFGAVGDRIVITAGVPFGTLGATNTLRIAWIS